MQPGLRAALRNCVLPGRWGVVSRRRFAWLLGGPRGHRLPSRRNSLRATERDAPRTCVRCVRSLPPRRNGYGAQRIDQIRAVCSYRRSTSIATDGSRGYQGYRSAGRLMGTRRPISLQWPMRIVSGDLSDLASLGLRNRASRYGLRRRRRGNRAVCDPSARAERWLNRRDSRGRQIWRNAYVTEARSNSNRRGRSGDVRRFDGTHCDGSIDTGDGNRSRTDGATRGGGL